MSDEARAAAREALEKERWYLDMPLDGFLAKTTYLMDLDSDNEEELEGLIEAAEKDPLAWRAIRILIDQTFQKENGWPDPLRRFILAIMDGERRMPPRPRGRDPRKNHARDFRIALAARAAMEADQTLRLTRNEATEQESASDIVSQELREMGIELSPDSVGRIATGTGVGLEIWFENQSKWRAGKK